MTCTCPPECTTGDTWGDGPRPCAGDCRPCRIMAGRPYVKRRKTRRWVGNARPVLFDKPAEVDP